MPSKRRLRWALLPVGIAAAVVLAGCTPTELNGFLPGFEEGGVAATNHTEMVSGLWVNSWIVLLVVGVVTWGLMGWAAVVYRRRKGQVGPAGPAALQHADRDLLHDRAAHPRRRLLRLHGA